MAADAVLCALRAAETGAGFAIMRTVQYVAMSLGVAILGRVLNSAYRSGLGGHLVGLPTRAQAAAEESLGGAATVPHVFAEARDAYANGMSHVMLVSAAVLVAAAILVALFLPSRVSAADAATVARRRPRTRAALTASSWQERLTLRRRSDR